MNVLQKESKHLFEQLFFLTQIIYHLSTRICNLQIVKHDIFQQKENK